MKRFNVLYVGLMSFFVVFGLRGMDISVLANPTWEPKTTEDKVVTDISAFIQKPRVYLLYDLSHSITQRPILEKIQLFISRDDSLENINWSNRISSYSNATTITPETINDFKKLRLAIIGSANTPLLCNELKNIFSQSKIEDELYTRELIDILKEKKKPKKEKDSLESLIGRMQDKVIAPTLTPYFKPDFAGAETILSLICDTTYFDKYPRQINAIIDSQDSDKQKRQKLSHLYDELENLQKIVGENKKTTSNILNQKLDIKKSYKTLQNVAIPFADLPAIEDPFGQSSLNWNDTFNDLNASTILSDNNLQDLNKQQAFESFEKASQSFLSTINSLQNQPKKSNYNEIVQSLDTMIAFIYKHDLSPQKQNAPYTAYRCWLLELIKKTIETNNNFSEDMINDWKNEVSAVTEVTQERFQSTGGNLGETKIQMETLIAAKKKTPSKIKGVPSPISAPIALSPEEMQKKETVKASISEMEKQLGPNAFNATFLSNFLTELKIYKKMLLSKEKKEQVRISSLIKDIAKKIRKIAVIKPRPESKKKMITKELQNIAASVSSQSSIDIEKAIASLEKLLPVGDYDALEAINRDDAQLYSLLLTTLNKCVQSLLISETKRLNEDSELDLRYFKRMSYQISLFKSLQEATSDDTRLALIIKSYYRVINLGINSLIKQIKTPDSWLNKSADMRTNVINQYLGNDVILQPYLEQINAAIEKQKQQEVPQIPAVPVEQPAPRKELQMSQITPTIPQIPTSQPTTETVRPRPQEIVEQGQEELDTQINQFLQDVEPILIKSNFENLIGTINIKIQNKRFAEIHEDDKTDLEEAFKSYIQNETNNALKEDARQRYNATAKNIDDIRQARTEIDQSITDIRGLNNMELFDAKGKISENAEKIIRGVIALADNLSYVEQAEIESTIRYFNNPGEILYTLISDNEDRKKIEGALVLTDITLRKADGTEQLINLWYAFENACKKIHAKYDKFPTVKEIKPEPAPKAAATTVVTPVKTPEQPTVTPPTVVTPQPAPQPKPVVQPKQPTEATPQGPLAKLTSEDKKKIGITVEIPPTEEPIPQRGFFSWIRNTAWSVWNSFRSYFEQISG